MKLKDYIGPNEPIDNILLHMPDEIYQQFKNTGLPTPEVYLRARFSSPLGYFVKHPDTGTRIFPISGRDCMEVLDWEVIDV